jgi:parallel beta-helix repeat protein
LGSAQSVEANSLFRDGRVGKVIPGFEPEERMRRLLGLVFLAVFTAGAPLAWNTGQALGNHIQCGDTITHDTTLDSDLMDCGGLAGIVIGADNVTLDLNGHTVDGIFGVSGSAVDNDAGHDGVTVERGTIQQFGLALSLTDATDNTVRDVVMSETGGISAYRMKQSHIERSVVAQTGGIHLDSSEENRLVDNIVSSDGYEVMTLVWSDSNVVRGNSISGASPGITVYGSHHNAVVDNSVSGGTSCCGEGLRLDDATHNRVARNRISDVSGYAIRVVPDAIGSSENVIVNNVLIDNMYGIEVAQSDRNVIGANLVSGTSYVGIQIITAKGNVLKRNEVRNNAEAGIAVDGVYIVGPGLSSETRIEHNRVEGNGQDGILIGEGVTKNMLVGNDTVENGDDGIDVEHPGTVLRTNRANRNADLGIEAVEGVLDRGGNRAFGNGDPSECLNVVCK